MNSLLRGGVTDTPMLAYSFGVDHAGSLSGCPQGRPPDGPGQGPGHSCTQTINDHENTETREISEHRGFANLLRGIFGTFRNPPAHTPRATEGWVLTEADALDLFSMVSLIHRRLDAADVRSTR